MIHCIKRSRRGADHTFDRYHDRGVCGCHAGEEYIIGKLEGHPTSPVLLRSPWSPDGKGTGDDALLLITPCGSGMRPAGRKSRNSRDIPSSSCRSPSPANGKQILSGSQDNGAKIWDWPILAPSKATRRPHRRAWYRRHSAVKPDRKLAAAASGKSIKILGPSDGAGGQGIRKSLGRCPGRGPGRGDAAGLATGDKANSIRLWKPDPEPGRRDRGTERGHPCGATIPAEQRANRICWLSRNTAASCGASCERAASDRRQGHCQSIRHFT